MANIQSGIVAVGREALSENAEWLITYRTRAARVGERVRRTISEELAFLNLIQCKRYGKLPWLNQMDACVIRRRAKTRLTAAFLVTSIDLNPGIKSDSKGIEWMYASVT